MNIQIKVEMSTAAAVAKGFDPTKPIMVTVDLAALDERTRSLLSKYVKEWKGTLFLESAAGKRIVVASPDLKGISDAIVAEEKDEADRLEEKKISDLNSVREAMILLGKAESDPASIGSHLFSSGHREAQLWGDFKFSRLNLYSTVNVDPETDSQMKSRYEAIVPKINAEINRLAAAKEVEMKAAEEEKKAKEAKEKMALEKFLSEHSPKTLQKINAGYLVKQEINAAVRSWLESQVPALANLKRVEEWKEEKKCFGPSDQAFDAAQKIAAVDGLTANVIWLVKADDDHVLLWEGQEAIEVFYESPWGEEYGWNYTSDSFSGR